MFVNHREYLKHEEEQDVYIGPITKTKDGDAGNSFAAKPKGRLLLVEDHDINQILIEAMTDQLGYHTELAVDGADAVARIDLAQSENNPIDLVLMDLQMPVMDGFEATRMIRASGVSKTYLPIVAISANADKDNIDRCLAAGMQDHIAKPILMEQLQQVLEERIPSKTGNHSEPAPSIKTNEFSDELNARYAQRREQVLCSLRSLVRIGTFSDRELQEALDHLHQLTGTAAMFGESELGTQAKKLEDGIHDWNVQQRPEKVRECVSTLLAIAQTSAKKEGSI